MSEDRKTDPQDAFVARLPGSAIPGADKIAEFLKDRPAIDLGTVDLSTLSAEIAEDPSLAEESAADISETSEGEFVDKFGDRLGDDEAAKLHRAACRLAPRIRKP